MSIMKKKHMYEHRHNYYMNMYTMYIGSFHIKSPNALHCSDPDFDETAYIWSL